MHRQLPSRTPRQLGRPSPKRRSRKITTNAATAATGRPSHMRLCREHPPASGIEQAGKIASPHPEHRIHFFISALFFCGSSDCIRCVRIGSGPASPAAAAAAGGTASCSGGVLSPDATSAGGAAATAGEETAAGAGGKSLPDEATPQYPAAWQGRPGGRTRLLQAAAAAQGIGDDPLEAGR